MRFQPHFCVQVIPPELVFLLYEGGHRVLRGRPYVALAPHLEQGGSVDELVERLSGELQPAEVHYCLDRLNQRGLLVNDVIAYPVEQSAFWSAQGLSPGESWRKLGRAQVCLHALGQVETEPLRRALESLGIASNQDGLGFPVLVVDDYLQPGLHHLNRTFVKAGQPWLICKPNGIKAWLGPLFIPGVTGCWDCLATRLRRNREVESFVKQQQGLEVLPVSRAQLNTTLIQAAQQAATQIARYLAADQNAELQGRIVTHSFETMETEVHLLSRRPQCPACGSPQARALEPIRLTSRPVNSSDDAGYRHTTSQQTWEALRGLVSPITGVVQQLVRSDSSGDMAPVYTAGHNQAQLNRGYHALQAGLRSQSSGKGKTDLQARVSGLCEAIERYSGVYRGEERIHRTRLAQLGQAAVHPARLLLFSDEQYRQRDQLNDKQFEAHFIPRPFADEEEIDWSPVWSLTAKEVRYVPTAYCYYGYHDPQAQQCSFCCADSNGNAAGGSLEDAILQGVLELVERDSVALWWYNRISRSGVDLDSLNDPYLARLQQYYRDLERELWVLDVTSDLGIPTYAAVSRSTAGASDEILFGFGAHLEPRLGVLRAVEEMNQSLPQLLAWKKGQLKPDAITDKFWRRATLKKQTYLSPGPGRVSLASGRPASVDLKEAVEACKKRVEERGMEFLVLDQTRPDIGVPVVKVMVPGLRHFWPRFAPGRLYEVPVQMGWQVEPTPESELNRLPMIL